MLAGHAIMWMLGAKSAWEGQAINLAEQCPAAETTLDDILAHVREWRGIDFQRYRRSAIERRTLARLRLLGLETYGQYLCLLQADEAELDRLVAHLTIKVSRFYRNAQTFDLLRRVAFPDLYRRHPERPLRLWSAGCGQGEEPYTLAMLVLEAEREGAPPGATILATDVDERAIAAASAGVYRPEALAELPSALVEAYFTVVVTRAGARYAVSDTVRARVTFLHHDLAAATEAPDGLCFDLVSCRNVLIYFDLGLQERVQRLLGRSLVPGGYLCLGEAEYLSLGRESAYEVIDRQARLFRRKGLGALPEVSR